jgi:hypothetical protein
MQRALTLIALLQAGFERAAHAAETTALRGSLSNSTDTEQSQSLVSGMFTKYPHINCYNGHGGAGPSDFTSETTAEDCQNTAVDNGKRCFVYMSQEGWGKCFMRDWCEPLSEQCENGTVPGTDQYKFDTYVQRNRPWDLYQHTNCYEGHGGAGPSEFTYVASVMDCQHMAFNSNKPCFVYMHRGGKCFMRDWCEPLSGECEVGNVSGTDQYLFDTYDSR